MGLPNHVQQQMLVAMEEILDVFMERYGRTTSLQEVRLALISQRQIVTTGRGYTVSELSAASGVPMSTTSAILRKYPHVRLVPDPNDDRVRRITVDEMEASVGYLDALAQVMIRARKRAGGLVVNERDLKDS